jgi:endonuclease/exonuclease/phosphatase family metal-dependent hydrolase
MIRPATFAVALLLVAPLALAEEIKIATYNVEVWNDSFAAHAAATQPIAKDPTGAELLRILRRENDEDNWEVAQVILDPKFSPDILVIQEGPDQSDLRFFNKRWMNETYDWVQTLPSNTDRHQHLCILLKKGFRIITRKDQYRSEPDPSGANARGAKLFARGPVFLLIQSPGGYKFWVGVTHMKSKNPGTVLDAAGKRVADNAPEMLAKRVEDSKWRNREATRTHEIIKELEKAGPSDVMLLGDMNDAVGMDESEKQAGADSILTLVGPPADGLTLATQPLIDAKKISFHNYDDTRHREMIDHVIVTKSMKPRVEKVQVIDDLPFSRVASDHFPVMATIKTN